ncbi:LAMI_0C09076g1_1 [Lachancea mirantina]|uniref:LAMI_0C09076g1_1 n=1 Tax=Lachancea mirantina TaxID=1230905 RepID=A0A1G4J597_9SACH|nr:LAMI_0C09076g1_1 [Lachancea mirantina]
MTKFVERGNFVFIYPFVFVAGVLVRLLVRAATLENERKTHYLLTSNNFINQIFAYHGNEIWTVLFLLMTILQIRFRAFEVTSLPRNARDDKIVDFKSLLKQYFSKFLLKFGTLFLVFCLIDAIFIFTGGSCSTSNTFSAEKCRRQGGDWTGGFDISGHFCFLTNISLILWMEISSFQKYVNDLGLHVPFVWKSIPYLVTSVLVLWTGMLCVTSVFYHTLGEKLLGLILGYTCPVVMYRVVPSNATLRKWLY